MSEVKVNKISPRTNCGTVQLGDSGDTITIPSGATISNSGTASGFGSTGEVSWNTTKITADPGNAVSGVGYFTDTSGGAFNVTLPSSPSAGNVIAVADYANTWDTNHLTIARNGSNIEGNASDFVCNQEGATITFVYVDATKGWVCTNSGNSSQAFGETYITATGGTITECGDCKIHTFTGPGTFCVSSIASTAANNVVSYLVIAGGGGGGQSNNGSPKTGGGGGGAGGFREYKSPATSYTASPLNGNPGGTAVTVTATAFPITVGGGGTGGHPGPAGNGNDSSFSTVTSTAGGGGKSDEGTSIAPGGSGGGTGAQCGSPISPGGLGNTPPVSPPQGNNGGSSPGSFGSGGGGAGGAGGPNDGGNGVATSITGSPVTRAGGGGGGHPGGGGCGGSGGAGNGGGGDGNAGGNGTANTGSGGGGAGGGPSNTPGSTGGSGIVVIRYKFQ